MKYMGSKAKYADYLLPYILKDRKPHQAYVEPFVGGCNMIDKVRGLRFGGDVNPYLIAMWQALQQGWVPPMNISRELYSDLRTRYNENAQEEPHLLGYVGFNGSYGGRFYDGGYAGITKDKFGKERNYPLEAYKNIMQQIEKIKGIEFVCCDYRALKIPENSIIYCDKPYQDTKPYKGEKFDHLAFWDWCRLQKDLGHAVFVSEYSAPQDFKCLISLNAKSSLSANGQIGGSKSSVEKLYTI